MKQSPLTLETSITPPLAELLRPKRYQDIKGIPEQHSKLIEDLKNNPMSPPSLILWGPPGSGKTSLARVILNEYEGDKEIISAVSASSKEIVAINEAAVNRGRPTLLFVDEVHRFNKSQQDVLLPGVERGSLILIGATTENPFFSLNRALLSRCRLVKLRSLNEEELEEILKTGMDKLGFHLDEKVRKVLVKASGGDGRRLLLLLERAQRELELPVTEEKITAWLKTQEVISSDRASDFHYGLISAFIKSMRAGKPDAALFYAFRMMEGGEDPRFILRRMMIFAAEDIGNADPRALQLAVSTSDAYERLGLPEGKIPISQCIIYLSMTKKSRNAYNALREVEKVIKDTPVITVPDGLLNNDTSFGAEIEKGDFLPLELRGKRFYSDGKGED